MSHSTAGSSRKLNFVDPVRFTPHFAWKKPANTQSREQVFCEGVSLETVAEKCGTPTYLYSNAAIEDAYRELQVGLNGIRHTICFAVKSNGNLSILQRLAKLGSGFDIVSGGELRLLQHIGVRGDRIVFSGVGKSREEIREALNYRLSAEDGDSGILLFNAESEAELEILEEEAVRVVEKGGKRPAAAIRVNPDVLAGGHPHIATGRREHKFGLDWREAKRLYLAHRSSKWIRWTGLSAHIGSQITTLDPFRRAVNKLVEYVKELDSHGISLRYLDVGGGLGVRYSDQKPPRRREYAKLIKELAGGIGVEILLEPGRSIIAQSGVLLTRVVYTKTNRGKWFVIVDGAMNDLMRPSLYGAIHPITKVTRDGGEQNAKRQRADIVGPVCETGDCFLHDWPLGRVHAGELLAIWGAGAYGMALASNYNARCRPAEVLVEGDTFKLIRRRETQEDLMRADVFD
ncbi:MAG TPA: diaminopimelate decarboxylase [Candidatus Dormibacteraeota bacterium]|nr:diaminopimelate decarboxylase [Candidatus Dormibacteraeota bacterium]